MARTASPFTEVKLTNQTPLSESGLDQRLFSRSTSVAAAKPKVAVVNKLPRKLETFQSIKQAT